MSGEAAERRLAAILSADVAGYSRLMAGDEEGTVETLRGHRETIAEAVRRHRGRVVDSPGDNLLAELPSAVNAVRCAVEAQRALADRNARFSADHKMEFRIGVHLGDVLVDGERIYGDGINLAARLEGLAEPGGVLISGAVFDQVRGKIDVGFDDLGERTVKNIPTPVRTYRVTAAGKQPPVRPRRLRGISIAAGAVGLFAAALILSWPRPLGIVLDWMNVTRPAESPAVPDRPSLVILPFENLSGDPDQEYFSDGMSEDLTTDLAKIPELFVISRNTAITYKQNEESVEEIGRALGVRYVVRGSVRKSGDRLRVTAALVDATTGFEVWGERYDRQLEDIFELQSELAREMLVALQVSIRDAEVERRIRRDTHNLEAYERLSRGMFHFQRFTRQDNLRARELFERAIEIDPGSAAAVAMLGTCFATEYNLLWNLDPALIEKASEIVERAHALDPDRLQVHMGRANIALAKGDWAAMAVAAQRGIELAPSLEIPHLLLGLAELQQGKAVLALESIRTALRLNPRPRSAVQQIVALVNLQAGNRVRAVELLEEARSANSDLIVGRLRLAVIYGEEGRHEEAEKVVREILEVNPRLTLRDLAKLPFDFRAGELRRAGLPEG